MSIFRYNALSSANSLILEVRLFSMSLMYILGGREAGLVLFPGGLLM